MSVIPFFYKEYLIVMKYAFLIKVMVASYSAWNFINLMGYTGIMSVHGKEILTEDLM